MKKPEQVTPVAGRKSQYFYRVACPKCGAEAGVNCFFKNGGALERIVHPERKARAMELRLEPTGPAWGATTPKCLLPRKPKPPPKPRHDAFYVSYRCKLGDCSSCAAKECTCACHKTGIWK